MKAIGVRPDLTRKAWPLVKDWIAAALDKGKAEHTAEDVLAFLERGSMQLWLAWEGSRAKGCCITEIIESARGRTCNLVAVGGIDFKQWQRLIASIKAWAKAAGCMRLEASGRAGWERVVASDGWRKARVTIEMDL